MTAPDPAAAAADAERQALCRPAHPMILATYCEMISRWVRQRREAEIIKAERAREAAKRERRPKAPR